VVIGAGHNGLVAACYLARGGRRVVVVEAAPQAGGMTTSGPFIPAAPGHTVHPCAVDVIFMRASSIAADLDLARHGFRTVDPDPSYAYLHPDGASITFWRDPARTASDIRRFSPADARAYLEFVDVLDAVLGAGLPLMRTELRRPSPRELVRTARSVLGRRRHLRAMVGLVTGSAELAVAERFEHPVVVSALTALAAGAGPIDGDGSGLGHLLAALLHRVGVGRPLGGMQALTDALVACLAEAGGRVSLGVAVEEILVENGRAGGVRLADGTVLTSRAVLAACDPKTALGLLPDGTLDRVTRARVAHVPANAAGAGAMTVSLAVSGRVELGRHQRPDGVDLRRPALLMGTAEDVSSSFQAAQRGELAPAPYFWGAITSACDPSQAPPGQDVLYLFAPAMPLHPPGGWRETSSAAEKALLARAGEFFDGVEEREIGRWVETPEALARRTGAHNGCVLHVDFGLLRSGPLRPALGLGGYTTPVGGLFLGGAGSHPGGGVSGIPGQLAAGRVRRHLESGPS
jgi:phytoene dehydrogenase-like protein